MQSLDNEIEKKTEIDRQKLSRAKESKRSRRNAYAFHFIALLMPNSSYPLSNSDRELT